MLAVMSFADQRWMNQGEIGYAGAGYAWGVGTFASLACVIGLALLLVCNSAGGFSTGSASHAKPIGPGADSSRSQVNEISQNQAAWNVRYIVRLRLDTGDEQSVTVMAPPGGLELAVRDMTGDKVQNDVVVTPALLHWPLTVLVNDGHNHFTVVISAKFPDSSASDQGQASRTSGTVDFSALVSTGFEPHALTDRGGLPVPPRQAGLLPSIATAATPLHTVSSGSGRSPPSLVTSI